MKTFTLSSLSRDQKIAALALPVLLFGVLGASYASASAPNLTDDQRSAIGQARDLREEGNYESARKVLEDARLPERGKGMRGEGFLNTLTDEQKVALEEAKALRESGDEAGAKQILEDGGIPFPPHEKGMMGNHRGDGKGGAVREAVANNDYSAFVEATKDSPFADTIDEDTFATLVEAEALRQAGDFEGVRALMESAGLPHFGGRHHGSDADDGDGETNDD